MLTLVLFILMSEIIYKDVLFEHIEVCIWSWVLIFFLDLRTHSGKLMELHVFPILLVFLPLNMHSGNGKKGFDLIHRHVV